MQNQLNVVLFCRLYALQVPGPVWGKGVFTFRKTDGPQVIPKHHSSKNSIAGRMVNLVHDALHTHKGKFLIENSVLTITMVEQYAFIVLKAYAIRVGINIPLIANVAIAGPPVIITATAIARIRSRNELLLIAP